METGTIDERTSTQKKVGTMRATHQRLWWMEMTRGLITTAFGLLLLTARSLAPRLFIYSLGAYLVIDGLLELYGVHRRKSISQHKALDYVGGALSLLSGLLSLVVPTLTLLLLAAIIAVRLIISGFLQLRTARRARGLSAVLLLISSSLFVLLGLSLLMFPRLVITLLVVFLGSYMSAAGFVLLLRGLTLRFKFVGFPASLPQPPPGLTDDPPTSTRRAVVFVRRPAATGLGHIAWGFEWMNGWFNVGSVENTARKPFANPEEMEFWSTHTLDPIATVQNQKYPYDEYKLFFVQQPHPKDAWKTVIWESQQPYSVVHHNCCDVAYDILRAYGCMQLLDPAKEFVPNDWYDALPGTSYTIAEYPAIPVSLRKQSPREIATREIALVIPSRMKGLPPPWHMRRWRPWEELTLVWEMMIGHIRTLFTSACTLLRSTSHR
ncbi:MAG TPA: DUF308 domain-containing protein [Ktedonobacteraceae bacterium]|nr:DUF308 domain-containing protein [Ktedonobacteraceae bacterium]